MSERISVMVTGVGGGGHGEQILKALRLADTGYEITATDSSPLSSGLMHADHAAIVPLASDSGYISALLELCERHRVKVVFHGSEPELKRMSAERDRFAEAGILLPINPAKVIDTCLDKVATMEALSAHGFFLPRYERISTLQHAERFDRFPAVLKPSVGGGGSAHLYLVQERDELLACARMLLRVFPEFIAQEYVGIPDAEFTVGVLLDLDGVLINSIAIRRYILSALSNRIKVPNRTSRADLGPVLAISSGVSQGEIGRFPLVTPQCEQIALALGARGPLNIQCRLVDERVCVFEINPRFSGTTSLRAMVGYNEPDILIRRHLLGADIDTHFEYGSGVIMRSLSETLVERPG